MKERVGYIWLIWLVIVSLLFGLVAYYYNHFANKLRFGLSSDPASWGAFGDFIGGVANPIIGLFTATIIIVTLRMTKKALEQNEKALKQAQAALEQGEEVIKQNAVELKESREELKQSRIAQQKLAGTEDEKLKRSIAWNNITNFRMILDDLSIVIMKELQATAFYSTSDNYVSGSILDQIAEEDRPLFRRTNFDADTAYKITTKLHPISRSLERFINCYSKIINDFDVINQDFVGLVGDSNKVLMALHSLSFATVDHGMSYREYLEKLLSTRQGEDNGWYEIETTLNVLNAAFKTDNFDMIRVGNPTRSEVVNS